MVKNENWVRSTNKNRKDSIVIDFVVCHICRHLGGTLKLERHHETEEVVLNKEGKKLYYHHSCKVRQISDLISDEMIKDANKDSLSNVVDEIIYEENAKEDNSEEDLSFEGELII